MSRFRSNGKLLLTGEYVILDGALALAIPTKFGQSLNVTSIDEPKIIWQSFDENEKIWFECELIIHSGEILNQVQNNKPESERLRQILNVARQLNPLFLNSDKGYHIKTKLDFPRNWGLGTSSTLINNISNWTNVNAYELLDLTFGGSGYDIACAQYNTPITYRLNKKTLNQVPCVKRVIKEVNFNPEFKNNLYFVFLNKKQNSRDGIAHYKASFTNNSKAILDISEITLKILNCKSLSEFESLINLHEQIISKITKQKPVKEELFKDFNGSIKSLGAWGGDFILVTSNENPKAYFKSKGFETLIPYKDMLLCQ